MRELSFYEALMLIKYAKRRQVSEYKMQTMIASYPWFKEKDREKFNNSLDQMAEEDSVKRRPKLDKVGFEALRFMMSQNPRIIVKG